MILFKFSQKKIVLDCFTSEKYVLETAPIVPAMKNMPEWWKELPNTYMENSLLRVSTMRSCVGMVDYYKNSVVIPLWSDLAIGVDGLGGYLWNFSDRTTRGISHEMDKQAKGFLSTYAHLKIEPPWQLKTKEDIKWVWSHPVYNYTDSNDIVSLPAIVSYKHQHSVNINILINMKEQKNILIPQGQTMVHMTPMSDRKVKIVRHLVSQTEFTQIRSRANTITFFNKYKNVIKRVDQFKDCPFHNHTKTK
jgi:hypothetical protein